MKNYNSTKYLTILAVMLLVFSCTPFGDLTDDPNKATSVPPSMLLSEVLNVVNNISDDGPWRETQRDNQFWVICFDYYGDQDYNWGAANFRYNTLSTVIAMEKEAKGLDNQEKYEAIAKFFKAYFYDYMSKRLGNIPLTEALQASSEIAITQPKYDDQKSVYIEVLDLLEAANDQITKAKTQVGTSAISGDFFFNGDLDKWQKTINAYHLRVLISLSKKNADLNIASKVNAIISNPSKYPLFSGISDNMMRTFSDEQGNRYELNPTSYGFSRNRNIIGATYLDLLKANNDPRIYVVADPAPFFFKANDPLNLNAYVGAKTGDEQGQMQVDSDAGKYSYPSEKRYYSTFKGEPYIQIGYSEQEFNIAEAINRGWTTGNAETHYENAIKGSMQFYDIEQADIDSFLTNSNVVYKGNNTNGLNQILTQKYVAFFDNSGIEAYCNFRRTGIPSFDIGPANKNGGKIPLRWKYPVSEFENNTTNVNAALGSQYSGSDDINATMWIIK
ncbi:SusD/RagB family nutrient-binding outer membrane lipoprotein [Flavobacterium frigoris]|uniref:Starch-binding associating with outer membrane n=1 Tax=Flavobacterium frigoris TaxID=229204 RepID=A0A1H9HG92_FLAFI|nr:SusD/RagB family nutrient-binding outer membrane lipoprotein [Flavobacterium frigoris]SEQ61381.1 Starch-binding associating with outer membrane [Flavobacterium frigoris]